MPELHAINNRVMARVIDVARATIIRLPDDVLNTLAKKIDKNSLIIFKSNFNAGFDSSGGFTVYKGNSFISNSNNSSHLITASMFLDYIDPDV